MWLETKGVPDHKECMFILILQLLDKEGPCHQESFPLINPNKSDKVQPDHVKEAFKGSFRQIPASEVKETDFKQLSPTGK